MPLKSRAGSLRIKAKRLSHAGHGFPKGSSQWEPDSLPEGISLLVHKTSSVLPFLEL